MPDNPASDNQEILDMLLGALARFPTKSGKLTAETSLTEDLSLDSVAMMELLVEIEDHFDVGLPLNMMADVSTVQDLADRITHLIGSQT